MGTQGDNYSCGKERRKSMGAQIRTRITSIGGNEHGSSIGVASGNAGGSHGRQQGCDWCGNQYRGNRGTEELALALTKGLTVNI